MLDLASWSRHNCCCDERGYGRLRDANPRCRNKAQEYSFIEMLADASRFSSFIRVGRSGRRKMMEHGPFRRVNLLTAKSRSKLRSANFTEETSFPIKGTFIPLNPVKQSGGKTVYAWAVEGDVDADAIRSNTFSMEWPKGSAKTKSFPEIDRADWFDLDTAKVKILKGQLGLLEQLSRKLSQPNR